MKREAPYTISSEVVVLKGDDHFATWRTRAMDACELGECTWPKAHVRISLEVHQALVNGAFWNNPDKSEYWIPVSVKNGLAVLLKERAEPETPAADQSKTPKRPKPTKPATTHRAEGDCDV